jgi:hypothetical protein
MAYKAYSQEQKNQVKSLFENGKNKCEISRITGIPRATLTKWIHPTYIPKTNKPRNSYEPIIDFTSYLNTEEKKKAYSFILGVYLCDGHISRYKTFRAPAIRFFNDSKYPLNTQEWKEKLQILLPENKVNIHQKSNTNCFIVLAYSRKLLDLFPQYGEGKKHDRKLNLTEWQKEILNQYPEDFIRACIQSDGCIYTQKISDKLSYKRFNFIKKSEDIMDFFLYALNLAGISKEKYFNKSRGIFVAQNFSKEQREILEKIISKKE